MTDQNPTREQAAQDAALQRLRELLPLADRQASLPQPLQALHRAVIRALVRRGRPPRFDEAAQLLGNADVDAALQALRALDLIVLSADGRDIVGAYPVTLAATPHALRVGSSHIHAMCAVDALAVAPLFDAEVEIRSRCRVLGSEVHVAQRGETLQSIEPASLRVGIRWRAPQGSAAQSLCTEMVFLAHAESAARWHGGDMARHSVLTPAEAARLGHRFFSPLL